MQTLVPIGVLHEMKLVQQKAKMPHFLLHVSFASSLFFVYLFFSQQIPEKLFLLKKILTFQNQFKHVCKKKVIKIMFKFFIDEKNYLIAKKAFFNVFDECTMKKGFNFIELFIKSHIMLKNCITWVN